MQMRTRARKDGTSSIQEIRNASLLLRQRPTPLHVPPSDLIHDRNPVIPAVSTVLRVHNGDVHPRVMIEPCFDRLCRIAHPLRDAAHDIVEAADLQPASVAMRAVLRNLEPVKFGKEV